MRRTTESVRSKNSNSDRGLWLQGVLSVEAAVVLPLFLFGMLSLTSVFSYLRFYIAVNGALARSALFAAQARANEDIAIESQIIDAVYDGLGGSFDSNYPIVDSLSGLDFSNSDFSNDEILTLCTNYDVKLPFDPWRLFRPQVCQRVIIHRWVGYRNGLMNDGNSRICTVYVAETGSVYHTNRNCSHLNLSVHEISASNIDSARNVSGHKYYSCEHCHASRNSAHIYITSDGDRYHSSLSCSGLKRTVHAMDISNVGDLPACRTCSKFH